MKAKWVVVVLCVLSGGFFLGNVETSAAAAFPSESIQMVAPVPPGGSADAFARTIVTILKVNKLVPVNMVVENKGGGSGAVGIGYLAQKKGNPYYLLSSPSYILTTPIINPGLPTYDQFTPICRLLFEDNVIIVNSKSPLKTTKDLIDYALKNPNKVTFAGTSVGGTDHITVKLIEKATGCKFNYIAFTTQSEVITAMLGNQIEVACLRPRMAEQYIASTKQLRVLAASSEKRIIGMEEVPTLIEQGINVAHSVFRAMIAPKDIPAEATNFYINMFAKMRETNDWKKRLVDDGLTDAFITGKEFQAWLAKENQKYGTILREVGLIK
jgi:putative tricarboxylic transport membrane protein